MPWKNQGGGPWGSGPKGPWGSGPQPVGPRPPDLEDLLRRAQDRLQQLLPGGYFSGLGIALVPSLAVGSRLDRGVLVEVMPRLLRSEGRIAVVYLERELVPPQVRAFVDWMLKHAKLLSRAAR